MIVPDSPPAVGEVYLTGDEIAARVRGLAGEIAADYAGRNPMLVASLKAAVVFLSDLSRALDIPHELDFLELAGYARNATQSRSEEGDRGNRGGSPDGAVDALHRRLSDGHSPGAIRLLKDLDKPVAGRDVLIVEDVVDTGLTLNYLVRTLGQRAPRSIAVATLLDRPYRRLIDDLPVRYVGFTVPDELFVGYGFDLDERYRNLPDLHLFRAAP